MAHRYFVDPLPGPGASVLTGDLAHHLGRVLRVRPGEPLVLGDGRGATVGATVTAVDKRDVAVDVGPVHRAAPHPLRVVLAFCVVRWQRVDWLLEHGTEVGVAAFQPLWTARTRPQGERPERWQRIVQAAAGQCDRAWLPEVAPAAELGAFLAGPLPARRVLASEGAPAPIAADAAPGELVLLVGPEGGFDAAELAAITAAGFAPRRFGPHTLRTETAALVGAAVLLAQ
jgi:16S rRNA (uracil1498-N3)-methyltransferase